MAIIIGTKQQIDDYFASDALNQSKLKGLLTSLSKFKKDDFGSSEKYYEEKEYFTIGTAVDCILTGEEGQFNSSYYISDIEKKASDAIVSVVHEVFDLVLDFFSASQEESFIGFLNSLEDLEDGSNGYDLKYWSEYINSAIHSQKLYPSYKQETRVAKVLESSDYFKDLCLSYGKQILSRSEKDTIDSIVESLRTSPRTSKYFDRDRQEATHNVNFYYQLPIYFKIEDVNNKGSFVDCKALLDLVIEIIDEKGETVKLIPIDLKTMAGSTLQFPSSLRKYRYDIQASFYTKALKSFRNKAVVDNYQFIVESTTNPGKPLLYELDPTLMDIGKNGRPEYKVTTERPGYIVLQKEIKGLKQLMEEYFWYAENGWEEEKVLQENPTVLKLNWNEIMK